MQTSLINKITNEQKDRALVSKTTFQMDPNRNITKKFTKKFDSKVINRHFSKLKSMTASLS